MKLIFLLSFSFLIVNGQDFPPGFGPPPPGFDLQGDSSFPEQGTDFNAFPPQDDPSIFGAFPPQGDTSGFGAFPPQGDPSIFSAFPPQGDPPSAFGAFPPQGAFPGGSDGQGTEGYDILHQLLGQRDAAREIAQNALANQGPSPFPGEYPPQYSDYPPQHSDYPPQYSSDPYLGGGYDPYRNVSPNNYSPPRRKCRPRRSW